MHHDLAIAAALVRGGNYVEAAALLGSLKPRLAGDSVYHDAATEALRALAEGRNEQALFLLETLSRLCASERPPAPSLRALPGGRRIRLGSGSFAALEALEAEPHVD